MAAQTAPTGYRPGCSTRSTARSTSSTGSRPTRCRWPCRSTGRRWPVPSPTSSTARCTPRRWATARTFGATGRRTPLRCSQVDELVNVVGGHRIRLRSTTPQTAGRGAGHAATAGARHPAARVGALDLCWWPRGHLDAYYEDGLHVWDWAAGALIAAEAGARLRLPPPSGSVGGAGLVVAAAPGVAEAFAAALSRAGATVAIE